MERLERVELLARADEDDGLAGDGAQRQRGAAPGVALDLGEHDARQRQARQEALRRGDGVLAGHRVGDQQDLSGLDGGAHAHQLGHQLFVDGLTAGRVDEHRVGALRAGGRHRAARDRDGIGAGDTACTGTSICRARVPSCSMAAGR